MANEVSTKKPSEIVSDVQKQVEKMRTEGLHVPINYSPSNALKSALLTIDKVVDRNKRPAWQVVTASSVSKALLDMVVQGLTPAKTQCYFIVRGNQLQLQVSYFGKQAALKRLDNVKDVWANTVHENDIFEIGYENGRIVVQKFEPKFENMDKPIVGAYAIVEKTDDEKVYEVMTKKMIEQSWSHRENKGKVQQEFPEEMAKRTVINRIAKNFINTSDDSDLLAASLNDTVNNEYEDERKDVTEPAQTVDDLLSKQPEPEPETNDEIIIDDDPLDEVGNSVDKEEGPNGNSAKNPENLFENIGDLIE